MRYSVHLLQHVQYETNIVAAGFREVTLRQWLEMVTKVAEEVGVMAHPHIHTHLRSIVSVPSLIMPICLKI